MAIEPEIRAWCDLCLGTDRRVQAPHQGVSISIGEREPRVLDLCGRHHRQLVQPVLDALDEYGIDARHRGAVRPPRPDRSRHRKGPFRCQVSGCHAAPLKHTGTLWQHLRRWHGMTTEEYRAQYGAPVPLTPEEQAQPVEVRCEVKGCDRAYSTERGNRWPQQALISHMWGHHGIKLRRGA